MSFVHYWTDSPSSQYRNEHTFYIILQHESLLDTKTVWSYFEAGHGKVPYDGLGVTTKKWLIMPLNNASISFKMLLTLFHGLT